MESFSTFQVADIVGVTKDQILDWMQRGFITPLVQAKGRGTRNVFSRWELYGIAMFKLLIDLGYSRKRSKAYYDLWKINTRNFDIAERHKVKGVCEKRLWETDIYSPEELAKSTYPVEPLGTACYFSIVTDTDFQPTPLHNQEIPDSFPKEDLVFSNFISMKPIYEKIDSRISA